MSALVRKEARMLLPAWIGALVAATTPVWPGLGVAVAPGFFGAAILALSLMPFGQETSYGTFGLLLVQPEERRHFWRIKTGLLAVALTSAWMLFALCLWISAAHRADDFAMLTQMTALMTFLAFSGGLWSTLLLRDMVSAFFCTLFIPIIILYLTLVSLWWHWGDLNFNANHALTIACWVLAAYAVAGLLWARRLFLGAQDVAWTGGQISLKTGRGVSLRWLAFEFKGRQNWWTALAKKELQLQEIMMFVISIFALLDLSVLATVHCAPQWIKDAQIKELVLLAVPWLWNIVVPGLIGCVAVAEERRFNTLESLLCLPVTKREQFAVKFAVTLVLGIVLGGIIPWALARMGGVRPRDFDLRPAVEIATAIIGITFYASTMSRGSLQAIVTTVCIPALMGMALILWVKFTNASTGGVPFAHSLLFPTMAWPAMIITCAWLAFQNYKRVQIGWRVWVGNLTRAGAVLGCVTLASIAIFDRSWELFLPLESRHGTALISGAGRAGMGMTQSNLCVLLPDGRLWIGRKIWTGKKNDHTLKGISGGFDNGSNWVKLAANYTSAVAIKSDGTLWKILDRSNISQIGSDSDWKTISAGAGVFLAVKKDGTLWGWGHNRNEILRKKPNPEDRDDKIAEPMRIGDETNWMDAFLPSYEQAIAIKRDGSVWEWGYLLVKNPNAVGWHAHPNEFHSVSQMVRENLEGTNWLAMASYWDRTFLRIRSDGSLWVAGVIPWKIFGEDVRPGWHPEGVRVGTKSDWIALSGYGELAALEADGTLWATEFDRNNQTKSKHPSKYADWLAATEYGSYTWGLARDGTLSCWNEFYVDEPDEKEPFMKRIFLGPSRRPVLSVNILDK